MPYSYAVYTGNGATTQFTVPFPYIRREHVFASLDYVSAVFTWVNNTTVEISPAPANGVRVEVRRVTPVNNPLVDFTDGSTLVAADLDTNALQQTYINQEQDDQFEDAISINAQGLLDAGGQRITNVGNPVNAQDAATKTYVDTTTVASAGDSMTGALAMGGNKITGLGDPTNAQDAATKAWSETSGSSFVSQCANLLDEFDDRYLGAKSSPPAVDNDGNPLITGALYWDNTLSLTRVWTGSAWESTGGTIGLIARQSYVATNGQVNFAYTIGYDTGFVEVYLNGSKLLRPSEYTVDTTNSRIVLATGATAGDDVEVIAYGGVAAVEDAKNAAAASAASAQGLVNNLVALGYLYDWGSITVAAGAPPTDYGAL